MTSNNTSSNTSSNSGQRTASLIDLMKLKGGDPCPYCGQVLEKCSGCPSGDPYEQMNCSDCHGVGLVCPEMPIDYPFGRFGCEKWKEAT